MAARLVTEGKAEHVAVSLGADGAILAGPKGVIAMPAIHVRVRSAVGAGDSFVGAMVWSLSEGQPIEDAFRFGLAAGAAAAMTPGTQLCGKRISSPSTPACRQPRRGSNAIPQAGARPGDALRSNAFLLANRRADHDGRNLDWRLPMWRSALSPADPAQQPCICHCRMCQKQFGSFFGAFAGVSAEHFVLTRGTVAYFQSSSEAERGFCRDCGTPLVYRFLSQPRIDVSIGSLDRHSEMKPEFQFGLESREPWLAEIVSLPGTVTGDGDNGVGDTPERFAKIQSSNRQHPDHDT